MKKSRIAMLLCYILGLLVMALLCWLVSLIYRAFPGLADLNWVASMIPPFFLMILAILCHKMAKGRTPGYLGSYLLNAAGSGCAIGVLLGNAAVIPPPELLPALLPAAGLGIALCLLSCIPGKKWQRIAEVVFFVLALVLIGLGIWAWIGCEPLTGCALVFSGLFYLPFPFGYGFAQEYPERKYRYLSFCGFGAFMLIALVVILILSEGELLDGMDFSGSGGGKKKSKHPK